MGNRDERDRGPQFGPLADTTPAPTHPLAEDATGPQAQESEDSEQQQTTVIARVKPKAKDDEKEIDSWTRLCKACKEAGGKVDDEGRMSFTSEKDAVAFFKEQAKTENFFVEKGTLKDGKFEGSGKFFVGCNGQYYEGSLKDIKEKLETKKGNPEVDKTLAKIEALQQQRETKGQTQTGSMREQMSDARRGSSEGPGRGMSSLQDGEESDAHAEAARTLGGNRS